MDDQALFIAYLKGKGHSKSSIAGYTRICKSFTDWAASRQSAPEFMSYSELLDYVAHLKKRGVRQQTVQGYMVAVSHYFEALLKADIVTRNPVRYLDIRGKSVRKLYPVLSRDQLEKLYMDFEAKPLRATKPSAKASALRNKVATGLMVFQGLDVRALSMLVTNDIDVLGGTVNIRGQRTHNARRLALQAVQIIEMDRYINIARKELQYAFKQEDSDLLLVTGYTHYSDANKRLMQRLCKQEPQLQSAHQIRASVITHWLKQYNLREVQYMAGHKRVMSTEAYLRNDTEGLQIDVDRFHPMNDNEQEGN